MAGVWHTSRGSSLGETWAYQLWKTLNCWLTSLEQWPFYIGTAKHDKHTWLDLLLFRLHLNYGATAPSKTVTSLDDVGCIVWTWLLQKEEKVFFCHQNHPEKQNLGWQTYIHTGHFASKATSAMGCDLFTPPAPTTMTTESCNVNQGSVWA